MAVEDEPLWDVPQSLTLQFALILKTIHGDKAMEITEGQSEQLSAATLGVARFFIKPSVLSPKMTAIYALGSVSVSIYGPKLMKAMRDKKEKTTGRAPAVDLSTLDDDKSEPGDFGIALPN